MRQSSKVEEPFQIDGMAIIEVRKERHQVDDVSRLDQRFEDRIQWILMLLQEGDSPLDQIRVMKGIFLLTKAPGHDLANLYHFEPYMYGPFDSQVYRDLDVLSSQGLISVDSTPGKRTRYFQLTDVGFVRARSFYKSLTLSQKSVLKRVSERIREPSFRTLLLDIYDEFPDYAEKSVLSHTSN